MWPTVLRIRFFPPHTEIIINISQNHLCFKGKNKLLIFLYSIVAEASVVSLAYN